MTKLRLTTRDQKGMSLIFVASLGFIAVLAAMGLADSLISAQRNVVNQVYMNEASSACENAAQYALGQLNQAAISQTLPGIGTSITVPPQISGAATVTITITTLDPNKVLNLKNSPVYSAVTSATPTGSTTPVTLPNDYRLITAQAQYSTFQRTINVLVGPNPYVANPKPKNQTPFFSNALLAYGNLSINNGVSVLTENSSTPQASIASNQSISISPSTNSNVITTIDGNINAYAGSGNSLNIPTFSTGQLTVNGNVSFSNGMINNTPLPGGSTAGFFLTDQNNVFVKNANVLGDAVNGATGGTIQSTGATASPSAAPAPTVTPSSAAQFSSGGSATSTSVSAPAATSDNPNPVVDLGAISLSSSQAQTLILNPGVYSVSSLNIGTGSTLQINVPSSSSTGVQIYVQGNPAGASPISINGNVSLNGGQSASNFQMFYNGTQPLNIAASSKFYGQLYAPQTTATIDTTGGDFHGAIVANNLTVTGSGNKPGNFYFDPGAVNPAFGGSNGVAAGPGFALSSNTNPVSQYFNILSWQEKTTGMP